MHPLVDHQNALDTTMQFVMSIPYKHLTVTHQSIFKCFKFETIKRLQIFLMSMIIDCYFSFSKI